MMKILKLIKKKSIIHLPSLKFSDVEIAKKLKIMANCPFLLNVVISYVINVLKNYIQKKRKKIKKKFHCRVLFAIIHWKKKML